MKKEIKIKIYPIGDRTFTQNFRATGQETNWLDILKTGGKMSYPILKHEHFQSCPIFFCFSFYDFYCF